MLFLYGFNCYFISKYNLIIRKLFKENFDIMNHTLNLIPIGQFQLTHKTTILALSIILD